MKSCITKYGELDHIGAFTLHSNGSINECMFTDEVVLLTRYGVLVPMHDYADHRSKYNYSVSFYEEGTLRRIALNSKKEINTPIGWRSAELITFYKNGKLKRLFPLNGRISAYWEEDDEYKIATTDTLVFSFGQISAKIISYSFYENGEIKDLTLWPKEVKKLNTPIGEVWVRMGVSFYPESRIKSFEPAYTIPVITPIGEIKAFDVTANGISGDSNSLQFTEEGTVAALITSGMKVILKEYGNEDTIEYSPEQDLDEDGIEISFKTLKIEFYENTIRFNEKDEYELMKYQFVTEPYLRKAPGMCSDCESCGKCH